MDQRRFFHFNTHLKQIVLTVTMKCSMINRIDYNVIYIRAYKYKDSIIPLKKFVATCKFNWSMITRLKTISNRADYTDYRSSQCTSKQISTYCCKMNSCLCLYPRIFRCQTTLGLYMKSRQTLKHRHIDGRTRL